MVARHLIQLNISGRGYTLFAGDLAGGFEAQSDGLSSEGVSRALRTSHEDLSGSLRTAGDARSLTMRFGEGERPVVAYGCRFANIADDKGRKGIVMLHAVELDDAAMIPACVGAILQNLGPEPFQQLARRVEAIASTDRPPQGFIKLIATTTEQRAEKIGVPPAGDAPPRQLASIVHDVPEGAAFAWTVLARSVYTRPPPWRVVDELSPRGVRSRVEPPLGEDVRMSDLLHQAATVVLSPGIPSNATASGDLERGTARTPLPVATVLAAGAALVFSAALVWRSRTPPTPEGPRVSAAVPPSPAIVRIDAGAEIVARLTDGGSDTNSTDTSHDVRVAMDVRDGARTTPAVRPSHLPSWVHGPIR
jgi:hypothetical protein